MHTTSPSLLLVTLLAGGLSLGTHHGAAPVAAELPADTNAIHTLTKAQAELLAERTCQLSLDGLTSLDAETAKALAEFRGNGAAGLSLGGFTTLDADTAKAIAQFKADFLSLGGLTSLDAETAKNLAGFRGRHGLVLNGLTKLDADTAKAIAQFKSGALYLGGLTTLDADTAKALAANEKWDGRLSAITAFDAPDSVAIAQVLATRKGPLSLPNLKKISPMTLTALIQKEDVEIPLIETLELIQEPDGSVTEDFEIPKWLEERQDQQRRQQAK